MMLYFRGLRALYNIKAHGNGIYFATDTKEIIQNGLSFVGELPSDLAEAVARIEASERAIEVLNGTGEGSIQKLVNDAIDDFANKLTDDGTVNTFKELVEYAAENAGDLGNLILRVNNIESKNEDQDVLIVEVQNNLSTFKTEVEDRFDTTVLTLNILMNEKITEAFSWEDVL